MHGSAQIRPHPSCRLCIRAAILEWWLQYSIAWDSFVSLHSSPDENDVWMTATESDDNGGTWPC